MMIYARERGLSLVELMIALLLGMLLTMGLVQLFASSSDTFRLAEATSRIQESGRLAHEILGRAIRNSDYWGCVRHSGVENQLNESHGLFDSAFHDFSPDTASSVEVSVAPSGGSADAGTHTILLKGSENLGIVMTKPMNLPSAVLDVNVNDGLDVGDIAVLSDCSDGVVFQVTGLPSAKIQHNTGSESPGNIKGVCPPATPSASANCFPKAYTSGEIYKAYARRFEVRTGVDGRSALFLVEEDGASELIEGVVDMRVMAGTGPDTEVTAWTDVEDGGITMDNIKALRISLLVRSPTDNIASSPQSVCFPAWADCSEAAGGDNWTAGAADRHLYRVYTSTYSIRNRLLEDI